jgi:hypothetical protein
VQKCSKEVKFNFQEHLLGGVCLSLTGSIVSAVWLLTLRALFLRLIQVLRFKLYH